MNIMALASSLVLLQGPCNTVGLKYSLKYHDQEVRGHDLYMRYSLKYHRQQTPFVGFVGYDARTKNTGPTRERIRAQLAMLGSLNGWHGWLMDVIMVA